VLATTDPPCPAYPLPVPLPNPFQALVSAFQKVDARLTSVSATLPGLVAGITYQGELLWEKGYGRRDIFNTTDVSPPSLGNLLRVASITKVFTCILLFKLRDEGLVGSLDDPVETYLPGFQVHQATPTRRPITLRMLASHTSGLQRESPCQGTSDCTDLSVDEILARVANTYTVASPYKKFHYSNLGIAILGHALGAAANTTFEQALQDKVLNPLGLTEASFTCCDAQQRANLAQGVGFWPNGTMYPVPLPNLQWGNPDGGLIMSGRAVLQMVSGLPTLFGDEGTLNEFFDAVTLLNDGISAVGTPWEMRYFHEKRYWAKGKAGSLDGYRTEIMTVPALSLAVFVGVLQGDVPDPYCYTMGALSDLIPVLEGALWTNQPTYILPTNATRYVGNYTGGCSVSISKGVLYLTGQGSLVNLTFSRSSDDTREDLYRARQEANPMPGCRWLSDGINDEFVTFANDAQSFIFMGISFKKI